MDGEVGVYVFPGFQEKEPIIIRRRRAERTHFPASEAQVDNNNLELLRSSNPFPIKGGGGEVENPIKRSNIPEISDLGRRPAGRTWFKAAPPPPPPPCRPWSRWRGR